MTKISLPHTKQIKVYVLEVLH